jgi:hypothetical protein
VRLASFKVAGVSITAKTCNSRFTSSSIPFIESNTIALVEEVRIRNAAKALQFPRIVVSSNFTSLLSLSLYMSSSLSSLYYLLMLLEHCTPPSNALECSGHFAILALGTLVLPPILCKILESPT